DELAAGEPGAVRIDWHLSESDLLTGQRPRLERVARHAAAGVPIAFVADRSRHPVALAEGLDRAHPAVITAIGLCLDGLAAHLAHIGSPPADVEAFHRRLTGLV